MHLFIGSVYAGLIATCFKFALDLSNREALIVMGVCFLGYMVADVADALRDVATAMQRHE